MDVALTPRQSETLDTIHCLTLRHRQPPTIREIAAAMGISSPNGVSVHLQALRQKGFIEQSKGRMKHRGIRLANQQFCPCCGQKLTPPPKGLT
jgi:repressor LexA